MFFALYLFSETYFFLSYCRKIQFNMPSYPPNINFPLCALYPGEYLRVCARIRAHGHVLFSVSLQECPLAVVSESTPDPMDIPDIFQWGEIAGVIADICDVLNVAVLPLYTLTRTQKSARPVTKTPSLDLPTLANNSFSCPKCGRTSKSGKRSCCARSGAWFKKCGNFGDAKFDHTWAEGIYACKSQLWKCWILRLVFMVNIVSLNLIVLLSGILTVQFCLQLVIASASVFIVILSPHTYRSTDNDKSIGG